MEPAVGAGRLAAETEDETAKGVLAEGKTYVEEEDVGTAVLIGILNGVPDGDLGRVEPDKRLAAEG